MVIRIKVSNNRQVITPIRFARAVTGAPQADAPDPDDRGFDMGDAVRGWGSSGVRGAMVGILLDTTVRLRVLREDVEDSAELFVTSSEPSLLEVVSPTSGTALGNDGIFSVRGVAATTSDAPSIQVHYGAVDGPVIGEMEAQVFPVRTIRVCCHIVSINGTGPTRTAASITTLMEGVNRIWQPCGIQFRYREAEILNETVTGYATAGTVTTNLNDPVPANREWDEFSELLQENPVSWGINIYFVRAANEWEGLTYDNDIARPNGYGVVVTDEANANLDAWVLAHEIGHALNLDLHSGERVASTIWRRDIWSYRRLMWSFTGTPAAPPYHNDVGYGAGTTGSMLTLKNFPDAQDPNDSECATSRDRGRNPY
jgi:hypothetical protein